MKNLLLSLVFMGITFTSYAQISFEKGYFINNENQRIDCLIKNLDWRSNPTEFTYKLNTSSEELKATIASVKEFGIPNLLKYERHLVQIDRSGKSLESLDSSRNPTFKEEQLFLKLLVEGSADLFLYDDGNLRRFFFNTLNSTVKQLVYKKYKATDYKIGENNEFKQQLVNELKCSQKPVKNVENIKYSKGQLVHYFEQYNECINSEYASYGTNENKKLFHLGVRGGLNSSSLSIDNDDFNNGIPKRGIADFDNEFGFRAGIEAEFIMSFNKNKWAIILEPTYQYYKSEKQLETRIAYADYTSFEVPIGLRHYFYLNEKSKLFINGSYIFELSSDFVVTYDVGDDPSRTYDAGRPLVGDSTPNLAFGLGYNHNNKYNIEFRYHTNRDVLSNYVSWKADYTVLSVIFGVYIL